ncbi:MAG: Ig-like domain-containing protein [Anaerolineales bacterium]|jgi:uncharacterized repeat protein (TIGR01451 family)|nr:Ig-like domain-containing protein [Anaerolineales bacterium]
MKVRNRFFSFLFSFFLIASALIIAGYHTVRTQAATASCVPGPHSGTITADETWCLVDSPHILDGTVTVARGVTVTLEPGVTVQTDSYPFYMGLVVQGELESIGTTSQRITFTHLDTGQWMGIVLDGGSATLTHTTVEWGCSDTLRSNIRVVNGGNLVMTDSLVQECHNGSGTKAWNLLVDNATVNVSNSTFTTSEWYPIYILGINSDITLTDNILEGNYYNRILLGANAMMGHDTTLAPQAVWDAYELDATLTVPANVTLTLEPGVVMKIDSYPYDMGMIVQGELESIGTDTQRITFTSVDGVPSWAGLIVDGGQATLAYTTVEYGCSDPRMSNIVVINDGQLEMVDSSLQHCTNGSGAGEEMLWIENSSADIHSTTFSDSAGEHIYISGDSMVLIDGSSIEGASENGVLIEGDLAWVKITRSTILSNGVTSGDGVRNTGSATVILSGDPAQGNFIAYNQTYGANQTGLTGQIIATYNFWGDPSGPTHSGNPGGTGEPVTDHVLYEPWLTEAPAGTLPEEMVQAFGPRYTSPGETLYFGYLLHNVDSVTLSNAVLVGQIPGEAEYLLSSPEGEYWPDRHQVVWKLGDIAPGEVAYGAVQVRYATGLERHLMTYSSVLAAAENLPNALIDLDEYLAYEQITVISAEALSEQELDDLLAADAQLNALFEDAQGQGFTYYGATLLEHMSDGTEQVTLPMINTGTPGETIYLTQLVNGSQALHEYPSSLMGNCSTATYTYDFLTGYLEVGDAFGGLQQQAALFNLAPQSTLSCADFGFDDCMHNCLVDNLPSSQFDAGLSANCHACYAYGERCSLCAMDLSFFHGEQVENVVDTCSNQCSDIPDLWQCEDSSRQCVSSHTLLVTPCVDCGYDTSQNYFETCPSDTRCILGSCEPIHYPETIPVEILIAGDPNEMVGPEVIVPNQTISYTISYENVGEGTAYGVFVESRLPELFDANTLVVHDGGDYFAASRTLFWQVGELAAGAGGTLSFEVQVPASALSGTIVVASATVYFPSVPETTPTGDVVSVVANVAAYAQQVDTVEGVPVPVTLTGYTPTGNPLAFQVVGAPMQGELSGTAPNMTYTPAAGFEGVDNFTFQVSDGLNTSLPAAVMLTVQTGAESTPPQVLYTSPAAGAPDVRILDTPDDAGSYVPAIIAWFSEPLDPTTLASDTVYLTAPGGQEVAGVVVFVAGSNRVEFRPSQPLRPGTRYTATITTGVRDSSGNALAVTYQWSFTTQTGQGIIFLPIVQK